MIINRAFFLFFIFLTSATIGSGQTPATSMKIINYNVLHGFEKDTSKMAEYVNWVKKINPDVIAYEELNDFTQEKLEAFAKKYGHGYAVINDHGVTHPLGLTSKYPIVMVQRVVENMWHSYLYGIINNVHIFVTHLSPFDRDSRLHDIEIILAHAKLLSANDKIVVTGDFNSLSAVDSSRYGQGVLNHLRLLEGRKEPKSGLPIVKYKTIYRHNMDNGQIDYGVTNRMLQAGFEDAFYLTNKNFKHSAPTRKYAGAESYPHRIDYIWLNKSAAKTVKYTDIIQDKQTDEISDHYPVIIKMTW